MFEKTITFKDFFGNEKTEKRYFNLSEAEILDAQFDSKSDFSLLIQGVANAKDSETLGKLFKEIILRSYGEPSPDGVYFEKSPEIRNRFENSAIYNALYMELLLDADKASEFINKVVPVEKLKGVLENANKNKALAPVE